MIWRGICFNFFLDTLLKVLLYVLFTVPHRLYLQVSLPRE